ncbi:hypothetical protein N657DRAFT_327699 [Parathielavia appendiculata]|uniref:Uncharacterized protein n=1 Tax=Parathielavia appendiculata TaxID=2587402 RepID=A0AAN6TQH5_9PEZI|nr:hypothetical protein N657DRAFT_327699 [Parathielavia appendiculata]
MLWCLRRIARTNSCQKTGATVSIILHRPEDCPGNETSESGMHVLSHNEALDCMGGCSRNVMLVLSGGDRFKCPTIQCLVLSNFSKFSSLPIFATGPAYRTLPYLGTSPVPHFTPVGRGACSIETADPTTSPTRQQTTKRQRQWLRVRCAVANSHSCAASFTPLLPTTSSESWSGGTSQAGCTCFLPSSPRALSSNSPGYVSTNT